jgi:DNA (cytosine-5)-methyltransferase 1
MMVDLFAGCGGLSLGLHESGWRSLFAIERDPMAFETYRRNLVDDSAPFSGSVSWPEWLPKEPLDIENVLETTLCTDSWTSWNSWNRRSF